MTQENLTTSTLTATELRALIQTLLEHAPGIRIRVRPIGEMWQKHFSPILHLTASGALIVQDNDVMKHVAIGNIMQFEIESQFQGLKPHTHYHVR